MPPMEMEATLAVAITTAPRRKATFPQAFTSLRDAGFHGTIHVFAEPGSWETVTRPTDPTVTVHDRPTTLGCFHNWRQALMYLVGKTEAPWLLLVQDDALWTPRSAAALLAETNTRDPQQVGFLSPYVTTWDVPADPKEGWNECPSGWNFCGALALCLSRQAAQALLQHPRFIRHRSGKQVDAIVAAILLELGRPSYVHIPSLVDHIGSTSTLGHDAISPGLRGFRFQGSGST